MLLGPRETMLFRRMNEEVWSYHYQASASDNRIFNVHMDAKTGTVRSTSDQFDPLFNPQPLQQAATREVPVKHRPSLWLAAAAPSLAGCAALEPPSFPQGPAWARSSPAWASRRTS